MVALLFMRRQGALQDPERVGNQKCHEIQLQQKLASDIELSSANSRT